MSNQMTNACAPVFCVMQQTKVRQRTADTRLFVDALPREAYPLRSPKVSARMATRDAVTHSVTHSSQSTLLQKKEEAECGGGLIILTLLSVLTLSVGLWLTIKSDYSKPLRSQLLEYSSCE